MIKRAFTIILIGLLFILSITISVPARSKIMAATWPLLPLPQTEITLDQIIERLLNDAKAEDRERIALALEIHENSRVDHLINYCYREKLFDCQNIDITLINRRLTLKEEYYRLRANKLLQKSINSSSLDRIEEEFHTTSQLLGNRLPIIKEMLSPININDIQQHLDKDQIVLDYYLASPHSYVWVLNRRNIKIYQLPDSKNITPYIKGFIYSITARNRSQRLLFPYLADAPVEYLKTTSEADLNLKLNAEELSKILLSPLAANLMDQPIIFVPDKMLYQFPFAALPLPSAKQYNFNNSVITKHELANIISLHELANINSADLLRKSYAANKIAIIADPIFSAKDDRVRKTRLDNPDFPKQLKYNSHLALATQSAVESDLLADKNNASLLRLMATRSEALKITAEIPHEENIILQDFDVTRENIAKKFPTFSLVHIATNVLANPLHPQYSGILLSMFDKNGEPQNGFVRLQEIKGLNISAKLLFLSNCEVAQATEDEPLHLLILLLAWRETGRGDIIFSLWQTAPRRTVVVDFYKRLQSKNENFAAAALRRAMLKAIASDEQKTPYYWAAFQLYLAAK